MISACRVLPPRLSMNTEIGSRFSACNFSILGVRSSTKAWSMRPRMNMPRLGFSLKSGSGFIRFGPHPCGPSPSLRIGLFPSLTSFLRLFDISKKATQVRTVRVVDPLNGLINRPVNRCLLQRGSVVVSHTCLHGNGYVHVVCQVQIVY